MRYTRKKLRGKGLRGPHGIYAWAENCNSSRHHQLHHFIPWTPDSTGGQFGKTSLACILTSRFPLPLHSPSPLGPRKLRRPLTFSSTTTLFQFPHKLSPHESRTSLTLTGCHFLSAITAPEHHEPSTHECPRNHSPRSSTHETSLTCFKVGEFSLTQSSSQLYSITQRLCKPLTVQFLCPVSVSNDQNVRSRDTQVTGSKVATDSAKLSFHSSYIKKFHVYVDGKSLLNLCSYKRTQNNSQNTRPAC